MEKRQVKRLNNRSRLRRIVYTLNNYTDEDEKRIKCLPDVRAQTYGREKGENGTPHLQGAILFTRAITWPTLKAMLPRAHIERMMGTPQSAFEYCWKEDKNPYKFGDMPKPGKRNDLRKAVERIQDGESVQSLCQTEDAVVVVKFTKGLRFLENCINKLKDLPTKKVLWLYGTSGVGKTRTAVDFCVNNNLSYWISNENLKWFDGYVGQEVAILDDFRYKHCSFSYLLRLLDRYELDVAIKGGFVRWMPKVIFITTPLSINETFKTDWRKPEDMKQIHRRVDFEKKLPCELSFILAGLKIHCAPPLTCDDEELITNPTEVHMRALVDDSDSEADDEADGDPYERFSQGLIGDGRCCDCRWTLDNCICEELDEGDIFFGNDYSSEEVC